MKKLVDELNAKFKEDLKHSVPSVLMVLQVKVLLNSTFHLMYKEGKLQYNDWTEAMDIINNLK